MLYWTVATFVGLASAIPSTIIAILLIGRCLKEDIKLFSIIIMFYASLVGFMWCQTLGSLFLSVYWTQAGLIVLAMVYLFLIQIVDSMSRETVDPVKLTLGAMTWLAIVIFSFDPSNLVEVTYIYGEKGLSIEGPLLVSILILAAWGGTLLLYYGIRIYQNCPQNMKFHAKLLLISLIVAVVGATIILLCCLVLGLPKIFITIPQLVGLVFAFYPVISRPQLSFILPFKALRLSIIETQSGIGIFTHSWSKTDDLVDPQLFSGMLQGVGSIFSESLKRGNIRDINFDEATLIIRRSEEYPVACVLLTTKFSKTLRQALDSFAQEFFQEYSPYFTTPSKINQFDGATTLIDKHFAFVPYYD